MSTDAAALIVQAREWLDQDPDPVTRAELQGLLDADDTEALADRFDGRLQFGTAGLRGELGAGPQRMNRVIVAQAAAGLARYLLDRAESADSRPSLVVGYDARHNSDVFARDTAQIAEALGVHTFVLPEALPTPVLAFAIRYLGCDAGVMVTASHNPPQDNGYKVYLGDSSQIVPPADSDISTLIDAVGRVDELERSDAYEVLGDDVAAAYVQACAALAHHGPRQVRCVYTPMHGVGRDTLLRVLTSTGFDDVEVVTLQAEPDPDFPTVSFPNPEEPGAMDLALAHAREIGADIIIANDPDADRCAVGVRVADGSHRMLTGDEVGALLAEFMLSRGAQGTYAASVVSSDLLGRQAAEYGQRWEQTLTGFKWIGKINDLAFGYEEALGYSVAPHIARDKDGISAALAVLELTASLKADGRTLLDLLDDIARRHGVHATGQLSVRVEDTAVIDAAMQRARTTPPSELAGVQVVRVDDLADGYAGLPPTNGMRFQVGEDARIICRPSGTEPKLKCYIEVRQPVDGDSADTARPVDAARLQAQQLLDDLKTDLGSKLGLI